MDLCKLDVFLQQGFLRTFSMVFWGPQRNALREKKILLQFVPDQVKKWARLPGLKHFISQKGLGNAKMSQIGLKQAFLPNKTIA